ncbi:MAG TPA: hypothetical protein VFJ53_00630 [Solirubrobacterales bacterium]|nr:hypothetical protein [Solirubrobacterales bacterium]
MTEFSEKLTELLKQLEDGEIKPEQFKAQSALLIESMGKSRSARRNSGRHEEIETAVKMLRQL